MCQASAKLLTFCHLVFKTEQNYNMQVLIQNYGIGITVIPFLG